MLGAFFYLLSATPSFSASAQPDVCVRLPIGSNLLLGDDIQPQINA